MARETPSVRNLEGTRTKFTADVVLERRVWGEVRDVRNTPVKLEGTLLRNRRERHWWNKGSLYTFIATTEGSDERVPVEADNGGLDNLVIRGRTPQKAAEKAAKTHRVFDLRHPRPTVQEAEAAEVETHTPQREMIDVQASGAAVNAEA